MSTTISAKSKKYKVTKEHFTYFISQFEFYIKEMGAMGWKFLYRHEDLSERDAYATYDYKTIGRIALVRLTTTFDRKPTKNFLKGIARHEALHFMLRPITTIFGPGENDIPEWVDDQRAMNEHIVIRRIERILDSKTCSL